MFLALRPSPAAIHRFLEESHALSLSGEPVGRLRDPRTGTPATGDWTVGRGAADFGRARAALRAWRQFDVGWIELHPHGAGTEVGTDVALLARHLGFWSLNGCRVVYHVGDTAQGPRFGYAYATLPTHAMAGEEVFEVALDPATDAVTYRIRAIARPQALLARIGRPVVRALQRRFRRDSLAAVRRAVRAG